MYEFNILEEGQGYVPVEYCGILQNGCDWILLIRKIVKAKVIWRYVQSEPTFTVDGIDSVTCDQVAKMLEHAVCVADAIITDLPSQQYIDTNKLLVIDEESNDDFEDDKDIDEVTRNISNMSTNVISKRNTRGQSKGLSKRVINYK